MTLADYIKRTVDAAPPLTPAQRDKLAVILGGTSQPAVMWTERQRQEAEAERERLEAERRNAAHARRVSRIALSCRICEAPQPVHEGRRGFHEWVAKTPAEVAAEISPLGESA